MSQDPQSNPNPTDPSLLSDNLEKCQMVQKMPNEAQDVFKAMVMNQHSIDKLEEELTD
jgi:hypothetical protein